MDERELARLVAAEEGDEVARETERALGADNTGTDQTRAFSITEAAALGSFLASCAEVAVQVWRARQDRALLLLALAEAAEDSSRISAKLDPEKRLSLVAKMIDRLVPKSLGVPPSIAMKGANSKKEWVTDWLGFGTRAWTPTVLMPFADMDSFVVYQHITWTPPNRSPPNLPKVITIPRGFVTDLATIPDYFWWALPPGGKYGHAAILHDWLYWDQSTSRNIADRVFDVAMDEMAVAVPLRKVMWAAVRIYGGTYWNAAATERSEGRSRVLKRFPESPTVAWAEWRKQPGVFA